MNSNKYRIWRSLLFLSLWFISQVWRSFEDLENFQSRWDRKNLQKTPFNSKNVLSSTIDLVTNVFEMSFLWDSNHNIFYDSNREISVSISISTIHVSLYLNSFNNWWHKRSTIFPRIIRAHDCVIYCCLLCWAWPWAWLAASINFSLSKVMNWYTTKPPIIKYQNYSLITFLF